MSQVRLDGISHDIKCENCGKPAMLNYQKVWVRYGMSPDGEYAKRPVHMGMDIEEPTGHDNLHFCEECAVKFEEGKI